MKSCLYIAIVMYGKFRCLSIAATMLSVYRDRNQPFGQHILTPLWHRWMRREKLPIHCHSDVWEIPMSKHSCNDAECLPG